MLYSSRCFGQIVLQHRAVQGADLFDLQRCGLLEQVLHLRAVLAHDADVVPPGLVSPSPRSTSSAPNLPKPSAENSTLSVLS